MPVFGDNELMTKTACDLRTERCFETNIKPIMEELKKLSDSINEFKLEVVETMTAMPEKILEKSDKKFASKLTEKIVYAMVALILVAVVGAWVSLVIIDKNSNNITQEQVQQLIEKNNSKYFETIK